jgi:hypothetical protein
VKSTVVLDACILCNFTLCDLILRLAEPPELFVPRWSERIIEETVHTLREDLQWEERLVQSFVSALREHFPDCWVKNYEPLVEKMTNHPKDRHVAAAAAKCHAQIIVTQNLKHFPIREMKPLGIRVQHPDQFLQHLFALDSEVVTQKITEITKKRHLSYDQYLRRIEMLCPSFGQRVRPFLKR